MRSDAFLLRVNALHLNCAQIRATFPSPVKLIYGAAAAMPGTFCTYPVLPASWSTADLPPQFHRAYYRQNAVIQFAFKAVHRA